MHATWLDVEPGRIVISPGKTDNAESLTTLPTRLVVVDILKVCGSLGGKVEGVGYLVDLSD